MDWISYFYHWIEKHTKFWLLHLDIFFFVDINNDYKQKNFSSKKASHEQRESRQDHNWWIVWSAAFVNFLGL